MFHHYRRGRVKGCGEVYTYLADYAIGALMVNSGVSKGKERQESRKVVKCFCCEREASRKSTTYSSQKSWRQELPARTFFGFSECLTYAWNFVLIC